MKTSLFVETNKVDGVSQLKLIDPFVLDERVYNKSMSYAFLILKVN